MLLTGLLIAVAGASAAAECDTDTAQLRGDWGRAQFQVEIADTAFERAEGLMNRETLPRMSGMLFIYDAPQPVSFWMRNTLIPLDMIFIDERGVVSKVHRNAIPHDDTSISGGGGVFAVLEINGGMSESLGIGPGSEIRHPAFSSTGPAWPCD